MEVDSYFLSRWRKSYVKMAKDALDRVTSDMSKDVHVYLQENPPKYGKLRLLNRKMLSTVLRLDENFWEKSDEDYYNFPPTIEAVALKMAKDNPEYAEKARGINVLFHALRIMNKFSDGVTDKWLLKALRYFCEIYQQDPNINDIDAMIAFINKAKVISNKNSLQTLNTIPQEVKDSIDLNLDENLSTFVRQYAREYAMNDNSFGGKSI